jgi:RNA polymerase sigma-70 factor (ECF subfamily)
MNFGRSSDNQLMEEFSLCSIAAYNELVRRYKKKLFNYLSRGLINDRDVAEDIVQRTLIKVYECKNIYKPDYQFSTWVYTICRNLALNEIRDDRTVSIDSVFTGEEPGDDCENQVETIEINEISGLMLNIMNNLDSKYREVIVLRYLNEMPYEDIAEVTGKNVSTLKSLCKRGLEKIKDELEKMKVEV